jgi:[ribosomal protein S5]-alanine N-acetyltransferase
VAANRAATQSSSLRELQKGIDGAPDDAGRPILSVFCRLSPCLPCNLYPVLLETPRVKLREMTLEDAAALHAVLGDEETMRWYPRAFTREEVDEWIARQIARYPTGTGLLGIVLKSNNALIGDCGPVWQTIDGPPELEIGYHVHRDHQRRGYATEAARAVRDYAFTTLACDHVICMIRPENLPSRRVAEKNGLNLSRVVFWHGCDHCVYAIERPAQ